ncbi:MAG: hypothetical protein ABI779_26085 [Acidobacteriota bacterium]
MSTRSFDAATSLLARLSARRPGLAYPLAGALGALRNRVTRRWPAREEVQRLFPHLGRSASARVASAIGSLHERNLVLIRALAQKGPDPLQHLVSAPESLLSIAGPCILATFHVGALHAVGGALARFRTPVLALRLGHFLAQGALEIQSTEGDVEQRASALHCALLHLRGGGIVVVPADVAAGTSLATPFLGHHLRLAPGAFALAKWTGAPIVPVVARWTREGISVLAGDPLPRPTPEAAAAWLERYLLDWPGETTLAMLRALLYPELD